MSSSTTETSGVEKLQDQLNAFKKQSVSLSGKTGYFVSKGALDHFSAELEKEMLQSEHPNSLIEMAEELEKVRRDSATLGTLYSEAKTRISSLEKSLVDMKKLKDKAVQDAKDSKAMSDSSRATLLEQLSNAQKAKIEIQKEFEMARKGFDPEPALHAEKALAESKREISELQKSLEDLNRDNKNANAEIAKYTVQINAAQQEIAKCKEEINKASEARKLNSCNPIEQVKVPPVELNSRVARLVLGKQGVLWLQKAEQVVYDDYREKAYNLMLACKKGNTPNVKSIGNLLEIVYKWLKVQAQYVRKKVASWLTMIEKDLRQGTLRRVSYYRDELKKLQVQILDESKANGKADGSKGHRDFNEHPLAWWEHVYYGVIVLKNRSVRKTSSFFGKMIFEAQRAKSWLLNLFGHGKGKYRAYGKPSDETEEIFDHDTYADKLKAHDDATEKDKIKLTEMPPEPLKEDFQESTVGMAEKPKKPLQRPLRKAFGGGGSPAAAKLEELFGKPKNK